jgi:hypothetical protein
MKTKIAVRAAPGRPGGHVEQFAFDDSEERSGEYVAPRLPGAVNLRAGYELLCQGHR